MESLYAGRPAAVLSFAESRIESENSGLRNSKFIITGTIYDVVNNSSLLGGIIFLSGLPCFGLLP